MNSVLSEMPFIRVNDIFDELFDENNRLFRQLLFSNKLINVLNKFKISFDLITCKLKTNLNSKQLKTIENLAEEYEEVVNETPTEELIKFIENKQNLETNDNQINGFESLLKEIDLNNEPMITITKTIEKLFECPIIDCKRLFISEDLIQRHINIEHKNQTICTQIIDILFEIITENNRLLKQILFANKMIKILEKIKIYFNLIIAELNAILNLNDLKAIEEISEEYKELTDQTNDESFASELSENALKFPIIFKPSKAEEFQIQVNQMNNVFKCNECDKQFKTKSTLKSHINVIHTHLPRLYSCQQIGCQYRAKDIICSEPTHHKNSHIN